MTQAQQQAYKRLQSKVQEAYKVMQQNTDKTKHDILAKKWVDATVKADAYLMKYL